MRHPLLLDLLPDRLRLSAWARLYRGKHERWLPLYEAAALKYAPQARMRLVAGDLISDAIAFTGLYELALTRRVVKLARQGGTLIELGANLGYFALLWSAQNSNNRCIAFEASPRNITILRDNVVRNGLQEQIEVKPVAVGSKAGKMLFDTGPIQQTGWGGLALVEREGSIEVDVMRVDDVVKPGSSVALLKVDIEGADAWALMGCEALLRTKSVKEIWYEQNKPRMTRLGISLDMPQEYLRSLGYVSVPQNDPRDELVEWRAVPTEHLTAGETIC